MSSAVRDNQIKKMLSKYKNLAATKKDVLDALDNYRGLSYSLQKFVFNDGSSKELFNLVGTIPVVYKNNTYHIPIIIWLMDTHPDNAPLCFVDPTPTMQIKVSMYVDHNGKIYLPYLHDWQPQSSDLLGLIQVMVVTFGEFPPVYSKPKESAAPYPTSQSFMPTPNAGPNPYSGYPGMTHGMPQPPQPFESFVPLPARVNYPGGGGPVYPMSNTPYPQSQFNSFPTSNQTGTITEEHIKLSLISAVEDKLKRRIQERVNQYQAEIQTLKRTKQELNEGRQKVDTIIASLERDQTEMQRCISVLQEKQQELEKSLEKLEEADSFDVDEAVITTAPLYRQLLNAYAEEAAIEDAIYYLGEALRANVIDLESFLKHVRQQSRKQFMFRATMQKCRQKAGLAG